MKNFIEKIGLDKVAHFGVGGLVTALFTIVFVMQDMGSLIFTPWRMMLYPFIGAAVTAVASVVKELFDETPDKKDILAALIGSAVVFVAVFFGIIFYVATCNIGN